MRVVRKNVYYCDYCTKRSLRSLIKHEKHCTANPDRVCRLCGRESIKEIIEKYRGMFEIKKAIDYSSWVGGVEKIEVVYKTEFILKDIIDELDYTCPNCILAIIRCLDLNRYYFEEKYKFDYEKALYEWWNALNEKEWEESERGYY